ncbi:MAG: hypothetical protein CO022_03610 [Flavobacteriales bacterium CG_4_9_14_0_2_um_filter_32_27]|nr:MAG: hypothetical protein CO022_03610 [Flavobacteriales bacterium CG_4_9_14_0_2_um_filter_32_27]
MNLFKIYLITFFVIFSTNLFAQIIPNGKIDNLDELSLKETTYTLTKDGIKLATDIYLPVFRDSIVTDITIASITYTIELIKKNTQFVIFDTTNLSATNYSLPIIFSRTPYDISTDDLGGKIFPFLGYGYAMQDMRGRYASEGVYFPMYSDSWQKNTYHPSLSMTMDLYPTSSSSNSLHHSDGSEAIFFLADSMFRSFDVDHDGINEVFKYSNGSIGMYGASALGNSQYQALSNIPFSVANNPIKCLMPTVGSNEHHNYTLFNNGVFRRSLVEGWITGQISDMHDSLVGIDTSLTNTLHSPADYGYTSRYKLASDLIDWFVVHDNNGFPSGAHPSTPLRADLDASFAPVDAQGFSDVNGTTSRYKNLNKPIYHLSGWWDIFVDGQLRTFNNIRNQNPTSNQKLVIGPWTHQTIGAVAVGDEVYPENVKDVLGFDINLNSNNLLTDSTLINDIYSSELFYWYRKHLGGEPFFIIPESQDWQTLGTNTIRVPAKNFMVPYYKFLNYIGGQGSLDSLLVELNVGGVISSFYYSLPALSPPLFNLYQPLVAFDSTYFDQIKDIRIYITGPSNDMNNVGVGNYWLETDSLPFSNGVVREKIYLHQNQTANGNVPTTNEGTMSYTADPNNPVLTIGGNNMIPKLPITNERSQGSINLANPLYAPTTMNRADVISFETAPLTDTMTVIGFPKASLYAKGYTTTYSTAKTDFDLVLRILDVYPDGREMFITEGVVNAKAREYAKSIFQGNQNDNLVLTNIDNNTFYHFEFDMLPLGHTFGAGHTIKFLVSSSNHPKYQSNPHLPNNFNQFFRWSPGDTLGYNYNGSWMYPQQSQITLEFTNLFPSYIDLPHVIQLPNNINENRTENQFEIYPNPTQNLITINRINNKAASVIIYSLLGNVTYQSNLKDNELYKVIDISNFANGIYFISLIDNKGMKNTKKFVKN